MVVITLGRRAVKRVSSKLLFLSVFMIAMGAQASPDSHLYSFDYVTPNKKVNSSVVVDPAPIAGRCAYALGARGGDNFLVLKVSVAGNYIRAKSAIWTLSIPAARPLTQKWEDDGYEYRYLGQEWIVVGRQKILADKIISLGSGGALDDSTELWVDGKHGVLAYRPMTNPGRFVLSAIPKESLLDCR